MDWLNKLKQTTNVEPIADISLFHGAAEIVTRDGARVWIVTVPAAVKLIPPGAVYFLADEIMLLQKAGKQVARMALLVKQVFGNEATITETDGGLPCQ